jgi:pimeloyl-ACP methyl ester carboxylesterase
MRSRVIVGIGVLLALFAAAAWWGIRPDMVQVEHRQVETKVKGAGSPAVVFENGFTGDRILWWSIQNTVAKKTLTITYERAGLGRSEMGPEPRTAEQIAKELHALLKVEEIPPPFILVGHSAGGLYIRVFAHMYPKEIAGLVFVDPGTEEFYDRIRASRSAADLEKMGVAKGAVAQWRALPDSLEQARQAWPLPDVPTVVFSSGTPLRSWPLESSDDIHALQDSQLKLVAQMPGSTHILITKADHLSILKEKAVTQQILLMVDAARGAASRRR